MTPGPRTSARLALALLLTACGGGQPQSGSAGAGPPVVTATRVVQRDTPVVLEYVGELSAAEQVEIRSRVGGILERLGFEEGSLVKKGQLLFEIDARPFEAALADARARLAEAEVALTRARADAERLRALFAEGIVARQVFDAAIAAEGQARAIVEAQRAVVEGARLDLQDTRIRSPLSGRIGRAEVRPGFLVQAGQTRLATVSTVDPMYAYFNVSEREFIEYRRRTGSPDGPVRSLRIPARLVLADGRPYEHEGYVDFADRAVQSETGTLTLRARFPNPDDFLRPGLFARVQVVPEVRRNALLVPERAVQEILGETFVTVVGQGDRPERRPVRLGPRVDGFRLVEAGLAPGDRVVVDGQLKATADTPVRVVLVDEAQAARPAASPSPPAAGAPAR